MKRLSKYRIRTFRSLHKIVIIVFSVTILYSANASATDARAIALGGSAISLGRGVHGVWSNPATLMHLSRQKDGLHLRLSATADVRDPGEFFESALDNQDIVEEITNNLSMLESNTLACISTDATLESVCIQNTQGIGEDFQNIVSIARTVNQRPFEILAQAQSGIAISNSRIPIAIHFNYGFAAAGEVATTQNDIEYLTLLQEVLIDGELTLGDITNSLIAGQQILSINPNSSNFLEIDQPQDVLTSVFGGTQLERRQIGISLGYEFTLAGKQVDIGITPKFSSLTTKRASNMIAAEFDATTPNITELFRESEVSTTTFTIDAGATYAVNDKFSISLVGRNLIPERADTILPSFTISTTPQFITGVSFQHGSITYNADAALNTAEQDGVITQPFSVGAELGRGNYSLRIGGSIDTGRITDKAAFNFGFGLGPLQVGARVSSLNAIQAGAQLSYSF